MEPVGFALIKKNPTTVIGTDHIQKFDSAVVQVMEFDRWGGILAISPDGSCLAMIDKEDIKSSFQCKIIGNFICPPNLGFFEEQMYCAKCLARKGGYNDLLRKMVIGASLHKGKFNDNFLWQLQDETVNSQSE